MGVQGQQYACKYVHSLSLAQLGHGHYVVALFSKNLLNWLKEFAGNEAEKLIRGIN